MGNYTKVKSKFIREKIKKVNWKRDRDYIDTLIFIEDIITGKQKMSWMGSFRWNGAKKSYPKEYKAIYEELQPKEFARIHKQEVKEIAREKREEVRWKKEERLEEEKDRKDWIKAGGKS